MRAERRAQDRKAKRNAQRIIAGVNHKFGPIDLTKDDFVNDPKVIGRMVSKTSVGIYRCDCSRCIKLKLKKMEARHGEEEVHRGYAPEERCSQV